MKRVSQVLAVALLLQMVVYCALSSAVDGRVAGKDSSRSARIRYGKRAAVLHGNARAGRSVREFKERGLQGGLGSGNTACPPLKSPLVLACRVVLKEQPHPEFQTTQFSTDNCYVSMSGIVYAADGQHFYYIKQQRCVGPDKKNTKKLVSYMEGDIVLGTTRVISSWWPSLNLSGLPPAIETVFKYGTGMSYMAEGTGMEMTPAGTHLLLTALSAGPSDPSWVVALSIADGSRSSIPIQAELAFGLTFDPAKTKLYVSDIYDPSEIFVSPVAPAGVPTSLMMTPAVQFGPVAGLNISSPVVGPYSFSGDGSCLYFVDQDYERLWTFAPLTAEVTLIAVGGEDMAVPLGSSPITVPIQGGPSDLVVTSDGLNVFFTTFWGELFHLTMSAPCGTPMKVVELTEHPIASMRGLALNEAESKLLVGTSDGDILEFTTSLLPSAPPATLPGTSTATPQPTMSKPSVPASPSFSHPQVSSPPVGALPSFSQPQTSGPAVSPQSLGQPLTPSSLPGGLH